MDNDSSSRPSVHVITTTLCCFWIFVGNVLLARIWGALTQEMQTRSACEMIKTTSLACRGLWDLYNVSVAQARESTSVGWFRYLKSNCQSQQFGNPVVAVGELNSPSFFLLFSLLEKYIPDPVVAIGELNIASIFSWCYLWFPKSNCESQQLGIPVVAVCRILLGRKERKTVHQLLVSLFEEQLPVPRARYLSLRENATTPDFPEKRRSNSICSFSLHFRK